MENLSRYYYPYTLTLTFPGEREREKHRRVKIIPSQMREQHRITDNTKQ